MQFSVPDARVGMVFPAPHAPEVLITYDGPMSFLDTRSLPGHILFLHCVDDTKKGRFYRAASLSAHEADELRAGDMDIRAPFHGKACPLMLWDNDGLRVCEISVPSTALELPEAFVTLDSVKSAQKRNVADVREAFRTSLSAVFDLASASLSAHGWVAEGRGGYAYDDPGYGDELKDMLKSSNAVMNKAWRICETTQKYMDRDVTASKPLFQEISGVLDAMAKARVIFEASTSVFRAPDDKEVRVRAEMWCEAMREFRDIVALRVADRDACPETTQEAIAARKSVDIDADTPSASP